MRAPLVPLLIVLASATAHAGPPSKAACSVACEAAVADCAATTGRAARCRRVLVRRCRRRGLEACAGATTTTSTTTPATTTTTVLGAFDVNGSWTFLGRLFSDDCGGAATSFSASLAVAQNGAALQVTFVDDMEVGTGDLSAAGWSGHSHVCPTTAICYENDLTALLGDAAPAAFVRRVLYDDGTSCQREWHGTVRHD